jgi:hypothetical protein
MVQRMWLKHFGLSATNFNESAFSQILTVFFETRIEIFKTKKRSKKWKVPKKRKKATKS